MDVLKLIISFITNNLNKEPFSSVFSYLKDNNFDLKNILQNFNLNNLLPLLTSFFAENNKSSETKVSSELFEKLSPIANVADKDIIFTLNKYFSA